MIYAVMMVFCTDDMSLPEYLLATGVLQSHSASREDTWRFVFMITVPRLVSRCSLDLVVYRLCDYGSGLGGVEYN